MLGHLDTVRCLRVDESKVISGSYDKTLKVWDLKTGYCEMTLRYTQSVWMGGRLASAFNLYFMNDEMETVGLWIVFNDRMDNINCVSTYYINQFLFYSFIAYTY